MVGDVQFYKCHLDHQIYNGTSSTEDSFQKMLPANQAKLNESIQLRRFQSNRREHTLEMNVDFQASRVRGSRTPTQTCIYTLALLLSYFS